MKIQLHLSVEEVSQVVISVQSYAASWAALADKIKEQAEPQIKTHEDMQQPTQEKGEVK